MTSAGTRGVWNTAFLMLRLRASSGNIFALNLVYWHARAQRASTVATLMEGICFRSHLLYDALRGPCHMIVPRIAQ